MDRELMPQLRQSMVKAPMYRRGISGGPNFKATAWHENSYQKGIWQGKKVHGNWNQRKTDSISFDVYANWFALTDIKGKLLQEFFETSALEIRTLQILSHQRNHLQVFPKALLGWRAPSVSLIPPSTHKHYLGRLEGVEMFIFFFFAL